MQTENAGTIKQGLKQNWVQFVILVGVNALVGAMLGMERSILPQLAETEFHIASHTALMSFIVAFGLSKAGANFLSGHYANAIGRKNWLLLGWLLAIPIPWIFIYANHWHCIVLANILMGLSQGFAWSSTVVMKIDLVGEKNRGLAMGLNEFAGYLSLGISAYLTANLAEDYGYRPYPFYLGVFFSIVGFLVSLFSVNDTRNMLHNEQSKSMIPKMNHVFLETSFTNKSLSAVTQAGMINNLNDGMLWGLLPILLHQLFFNQEAIGIIAAIYPAVWGVGQLFTGPLSDKWSIKRILVIGMLVQGVVLLALPFWHRFMPFVLSAIVLGIGTALVYPTFMVAVAKNCHPEQRASGIGVFRLWRDLGYAFGAVIAGFMADAFGIDIAIMVVGGLTLLSGLVVYARMPEEISMPVSCIKPEIVRSLLQQKNNIQIIDVRSYDEYMQSHIPMARHIPLTDIATGIKRINKENFIVVTCGKGGGRSAFATQWLLQEGYNAQWLCGGVEQWHQSMA
ncbi:MAG: MFS transporter [Chitinophagaceae bacterium]|nr:MFS transporter [Chitinophagaceae bacterium]